MHQPWRTLASIINKCLSGKTTSNNRLRQSRVAIIKGMFHKKYIDFAEMIWEDFSYYIHNRQLKKSRCEIMPYHIFTKVIINHFLSIYKSIPKALPSGLHTIKDDGVLSRMKFQSDSYKAFINYSTGLVPPKKTKGKGSHGKKATITLKPVSVEVSDESEPELARRRTGSKRMSKKKVSIFADDNITPEPDVTLELGKSVSLTEATEEEAARQVHATHERIVTESNSKPTRRKPSGIAFRYTSSVSKKMSLDPSQKLKASRKSSRSQPYAGGSSKGTGTKPVDESTFILATLHKRTGIKPRVPDEVQGKIPWVSTDEDEEKKEDDDADDDKSIDLEETDNEETNDEFVHDEEYVQEDDEETDDEFVHGDEHVHDDVVEEMIDAEDTKIRKDDKGITNVEKPKVTKGDLEQAGKPTLISSSLSVSSGFEVPNIQSPSILIVPVTVILEPTVLSPIPEIPPVTSSTTLPPPLFVSTISLVLQQTTTPIHTPPITTEAPPITIVPNLLPAIAQMVFVLEKDIQELKQVDHSPVILATIRYQVPSIVHEYLGSSLGDALQKIKQEQVAKNQIPKFSATPYDQAVEAEFKQKQILLKMMRESKSYEKHPKHKELYDALTTSEFKKTSKGDTPPTTSKTGKSALAEELDKEATNEVTMGDEEPVQENVHDADQSQDGEFAPKNDWFKQPPRPPTPDPEWNKCQVIDDQHEHPWFNHMLFAAKDPLTFDELMATPIDFSKFMMNRLKIEKLTKVHLVGPVYNLLKGTCQSSIKLENNMEECYKTLSNQLDS
ncbi:hypothetical protein Tco_0363803 [Tanacetum coccineum]